MMLRLYAASDTPTRPRSSLRADMGRGSALKQPSILDVVHGVKTVGAAHPEVTAWWYTPPQRLRLAGEMPGTSEATLAIEVVVEGPDPAAIPCAQIAKELSTALSGATVDVRMHRGSEERRLFRIVSQDKRSSVSEAPRPA
jgi:hypothetical protein